MLEIEMSKHIWEQDTGCRPSNKGWEWGDEGEARWEWEMGVGGGVKSDSSFTSVIGCVWQEAWSASSDG